MLAKLPADRQALVAAADFMEKRGHCQRSMMDEARRVCLMGAIVYANHVEDVRRAAMDRLNEFITNPIYWNDMPGRTKAEAVAALHAAALHGL